MGSYESAAMRSDVWLTPPEILDALGDLDPCAAPEPRPWSTARLHYWTPRHNGLLEPWRGRVWLNPPYSREAVRWLRRMAAHGDGIALTFARTETTWVLRDDLARGERRLPRGSPAFPSPRWSAR
jgi:hypothetical protein